MEWEETQSAEVGTRDPLTHTYAYPSILLFLSSPPPLISLFVLSPLIQGLSAGARASLFEVDHLLVQVKVSFDWLVYQGSLWWECATQVDPSVW